MAFTAECSHNEDTRIVSTDCLIKRNYLEQLQDKVMQCLDLIRPNSHDNEECVYLKSVSDFMDVKRRNVD